MIGLTSRLVIFGGYGVPTPPPFASYSEKGGVLTASATRELRGVQRYGKTPGPNEADTRPLGLRYAPHFSPQEQEDWAVLTGSESALRPQDRLFGNQNGLVWTDARKDQSAVLRTDSLSALENGGICLQAYLYKPHAEQESAQWWARWGAPGNGYLFQIRDGKPEFGRLAAGWTQEMEDELRALWVEEKREGLNSTEEARAEEIIGLIFEDWAQLRLESTLGRGADQWYNQQFTVTFIQEQLGRVHIILEGHDAAVHECQRLMEAEEPGNLWSPVPFDLGTIGGGFYWRLGYPRFARTGLIKFGPWPHSAWAEDLDGIQYRVNGYNIPEVAEITYDREEINVQSSYLVATLTSNTVATPWLYGLAAYIPAGPRDGSNDTTFDSDLVSPDPIRDMKPSWDGDMRARQVEIILGDVDGITTFGLVGAPQIGLDGLVNRTASLAVEGQDFGTSGMIVRGTSRLMREAGTEEEDANQGPCTVHSLVWRDGWHVLEKIHLMVPMILDGMRLGAAVRALLGAAGFGEDSMAGVSASTGRVLPSAALGGAWAYVAKGKVAAAIRSLMDAFGLGLHLYHDLSGVWQLEAQDDTVRAEFSSQDGAGDLTVFEGLQAVRDFQGFYNQFRVTGGPEGKWVAERTLWNTIRDPEDPNWVGDLRPLDPVNLPGAESKDDVVFALRALVWRHGRTGRRWQFRTRFRMLRPGDRVTVDGRACEVEAINDASIADNEMLLQVREV